MENPRPEKVAVVDEVQERLTNASAALADRVPRAGRVRAGRAAPGAARGRRRLQGLQEHARAVRGPQPGARAGRVAHRPDGHRLRRRASRRGARRRGAGGQGPARLRPHQPGVGGQGRCHGRQGAQRRQRPAPWPTSSPARYCWPGSPARSPPPCSSSPACSRPCRGTSPTGSRPSSSNEGGTTRPVPRRQPRRRGPRAG